jgi:hypothetical protein
VIFGLEVLGVAVLLGIALWVLLRRGRARR